ncbi:MAG TPA: MBL fold metallo-hydrolase, partial [Acidobacteriaceae bacterium]|nr:MBL fold metallo-hydrolase [Acidobacteriaceae bacterium]
MIGPAEMLEDEFLNPFPTSVMGSAKAGRMIRRLLFERRRGDPKKPIGPFRTDASVYATPSLQGLRVTWMGHSTLLIEVDGMTILTDP